MARTQPRLHRLRPRGAPLARPLPGCGEWNTLVEEVRDRVAVRAQRATDAGPAAGRAGGRRGGRGPAPADRHRRARPRARRRHRARVGGAARRAARDRQVDADQHGARQPRGRRPPHALRLGRGVDGAGAAARPAARRAARSRCAALAETDLERVLAMLERERPEACVIDSVQTLDARELSSTPGSVAQVREVAARIVGGRQAAAHRRAPRRARHQGRHARRAARPRAPRRLRAAVRGRARAPLPHRARDQEPLRIHQRGGRLRDAPGGPRRGPRRLGAVRRRRDAARPGARCSRRWRAAARCSSRSRRSSRPRS